MTNVSQLICDDKIKQSFVIRDANCTDIVITHTTNNITVCATWHVHCVSKNDTDIAHYNFNADQPILIILFLGEMLLTEYAIKWRFVIPLFLSNVSALPGKHESRKLCLFTHAAYVVSKTKWLGEILFAHCN